MRESLDAVFYVVRGGYAWSLLPHDFPPWKTVYHYFRPWLIDDTWEKLNAACASASDETPSPARVALKGLLCVQAHSAQGRAHRQFPRGEDAPASSTWTCRKTRSENSGAKGTKTRIIADGRVRIEITSFGGDW